MNTYKRHRFPAEIISYAVWLYYRFNLSHRDIEDLLAERGITVSVGGGPRMIVTDKLRSYPVAHRKVMPEAIHVTDRYANNRAEQSH